MQGIKNLAAEAGKANQNAKDSTSTTKVSNEQNSVKNAFHQGETEQSIKNAPSNAYESVKHGVNTMLGNNK